MQEIRGYSAPTRIANAPDFIKGVINLRGVIVPIIDLRVKFGLSDVKYDVVTVTIVLNIGSRVVGVVVDSVSDVLELSTDQIKDPPEFNGGADTDHITGIGTVKQDEGDQARERMLILIDIERHMSSADMGLIDNAVQVH